MKKQIVITLILLAATAYVTVVYFKNLNPPGTRTSQVMHLIPGDAALIFQFNNDKGFYDIFKGNKAFAAVIGGQQLGQLDTLRQVLLQNPMLDKYFSGQDIFISLHTVKPGSIGLLLTMSAGSGFNPDVFDEVAKQQNSGMVITPLRTAGRKGYNIFISSLKQRFYLIDKGDNAFSGSFSKELADESAGHRNNPAVHTFITLPAQQSNNSLANLYVNYSRLPTVFGQLFQNKNTDIFRNFKVLPALAAFSLNYRSDAIMFNGSTVIQNSGPSAYLSLFTNQKPVINHLPDIFPSTTAYYTNFSVSDPTRFSSDLSAAQNKAGQAGERDRLFGQVKMETAVKIKSEFDALLGNEFAIVTTRYFEKLAIVSVKDGSRLKLLLTAISIMDDENKGVFSYEKLPYFLLGEAFSAFRKPYFMVIDNYLVLANSNTELNSYYDTYINRKFLSKNDQYNQFENLLAAQSNVSFFLNFKNAQPVLERDMAPAFYESFKSSDPGWKNFYAASCQFSAADKNFYTNFCLRLNTDTVATKRK